MKYFTAALITIFLLSVHLNKTKSLDISPLPKDSQINENEVEKISKLSLEILKKLISAQTIRGNEAQVSKIIKEYALKYQLDFNEYYIDKDKKRSIAVVEYNPNNSNNNGLILSAHSDVVEIEKNWNTAPFQLTRIGNKYYGRGVLDMKGILAIKLACLIQAKINQWPLIYPLMLLVLPDEETTGQGAIAVTKDHAHILRPYRLLISEGGFITKDIPINGVELTNINYAEKGILWLEAISKFKSLHSSTPKKEYSTLNLIKFLKELEKWNDHIIIDPAQSVFFSQLAKFYSFPKNYFLERISRPFVFPFLKSFINDNDKLRAINSTTKAITSLKTSTHGINVIPSWSKAKIDLRLHPSIDTDSALKEIKGLAKKYNVKINVLNKRRSSKNDINNKEFHLLAKISKTVFPNSVIAPIMPMGNTDLVFLRDTHLKAYGLIPFRITSKQLDSMHSSNEYITEQNIKNGVKFISLLINEYLTKVN